MKTTDKIQLDGVDVNLEISLKEYGIAWHKSGDEITFVYGIKINEQSDFIEFDHCAFDVNANLKEHFGWIEEKDWEQFCSFAGIDEGEIEELPLESVIPSLVSVYGTENIFGTVYFEGLTLEELTEEFEI